MDEKEPKKWIMSEVPPRTKAEIINERGRRTPPKRLVFRLLKWAFLLLFVITVVIAAVSVGGYYYLSEDLPKITTLADYRPPIITTIYSDDGRKIGEFFKERRIIVPLTEMPDMLKKAFVSAEDARF